MLVRAEAMAVPGGVIEWGNTTRLAYKFCTNAYTCTVIIILKKLIVIAGK